MTQPWPYPSSLMIGCTAVATSEEMWSTVQSSKTRAGSTARGDPDAEAGTSGRPRWGLIRLQFAHHLVGRWLKQTPPRMHSWNPIMAGRLTGYGGQTTGQT